MSHNSAWIFIRFELFRYLLPIQAAIKLEDILEKPEGEVDSPVEGAAEHAHPSPAHDKGNQGGIGHLENRDMVLLLRNSSPNLISAYPGDARVAFVLPPGPHLGSFYLS